LTQSKATPSKVKPFNPEIDSPNRRTLTNLTASQTKKAKAHRIAKNESSKKLQSSKKKRPANISEYWTSSTQKSHNMRRPQTQYESENLLTNYSYENRRSTSPRTTTSKRVEYVDMTQRVTKPRQIEYVYEEKTELPGQYTGDQGEDRVGVVGRED
jgi:hypothetical protein